MKVLITGAAGFIGFHLAQRLTNEGYEVTGIDNLNDYYDVVLKKDRLRAAGIEFPFQLIQYGSVSTSFSHANYRFIYGDISDKKFLLDLFSKYSFDYVINLAAQAGVRYSLINPDSYIKNNIAGFFNILECCRHYPVKHLLYASSSSVYGNSEKTPFSESDLTDESVSLYAASKKSNELMAHTYSHLFRVPTTGLRFFTVYGPFGRPDMAYYGFTKSIMESTPIQLFNGGDMYRDFTYIDDIVQSIYLLVDKAPSGEGVPKRILNLGNSSPVYLKDFISILEKHLKRRAIVEHRPMQETDVYTTHADTRRMEELTGYTPSTDISNGLAAFCTWYLDYHNIENHDYEDLSNGRSRLHRLPHR